MGVSFGTCIRAGGARNTRNWTRLLDRQDAAKRPRVIDKQNQRELRKAGWGILVIWECQTAPSKLKRLRPEDRRVPGKQFQAFSKDETMLSRHRILCGDAEAVFSTLTSGQFDLTVTSPPYFRHRDYSIRGQIGQEEILDEYLRKIRGVLSRFLTGHCRNRGLLLRGRRHLLPKQKLLLVPHRIALAADDLGWTVRNDLIWSKTDPPPESPRNRWRSGHEHLFFLTTHSGRYKFRRRRNQSPLRPGNGSAMGQRSSLWGR